ncbi:MAG: hypothetical protein EZS28_031589 [Streblomastix strix]|uniref:Uncharacterized protein n=1 Tax=Streblomastix strix TaxID=222440 RepID=A0A5J4URS1_9EUKA|nr:MAG: hypothetical protein EZS28_031589 [Streblomastix strix]
MPTDQETAQQKPIENQIENIPHKNYNINKYKEVDRTTAQVESEEAIQQLAEEQPKSIYLSHPNLIVQKFVIDVIWRTITHRQRGDDFVFSSDNFIKFWALITQNDENDVEIVLEEAIVYPHTCIPKKYKKKDLIRLEIVLRGKLLVHPQNIPKEIYVEPIYQCEPNDDIRNQCIRKLKNKANWDSFVLTGCNTDPQNYDGVWKIGSSSSQFRIQKQEDQAYDYKAPIPLPPIDYAIQQILSIGVFDFFTVGQVMLQNNRVYVSIAITHSKPDTVWNTGYTVFSVMNDAAKPKFSGSPRTLPLNAVIYATKQSINPVTWINPVAIDCYVDVDGHIKINAICQFYLPDDFFVQVSDSYAVYNQSS